MNITKLLTPTGAGGVTCRPMRTMKPTSITIHNTANKNADALQHAKAQAAGNLAASGVAVHYYVDDKAIYQCLEDEWQGWHAGDGSNPQGGNYTSIGIEVCEHDGIDQRKAFENAAWLTASLCKKYGYGIGGVRTHQSWNGKYCPRVLLDGKDGLTWGWFVGLVTSRFSNETTAPAPTVDNTPDVYAADAVKKAVERGILRGNDKGDYMLHSAVTRQDMLVFLERAGAL